MEISGYTPGALGWCVALHARYYAEHAGFGRAFETKVAAEMAAFLAKPDRPETAFHLASDETGFLGAATMDREGDWGHLRWFIVDPKAQGQGVGRALLKRALDTARNTRAAGVYLDTFKGLDAAQRLYLAAGFVLTHEAAGKTWGEAQIEQRYTLSFSP